MLLSLWSQLELPSPGQLTWPSLPTPTPNVVRGYQEPCLCFGQSFVCPLFLVAMGTRGCDKTLYLGAYRGAPPEQSPHLRDWRTVEGKAGG